MSKSFMNSFYSPQASEAKNIKFAVLHENQIEKRLTSPNRNSRLGSPQRNPILQENVEVQEFKPHHKTTPNSYKMAMFTEEPPVHQKAHGKFYEKLALNMMPEPRKEGIKIVPHKVSAMTEPDEEKRHKKPVDFAHRAKFNPITEGDPKSVKSPKKPIWSIENSELKKMNDKKYLSSFEKGTLANKGKVYKDTTISLTHNPDPYVSPKKKQQPPLPEKHRGSIASVITYENVYHRPDVLPQKCTEVPANVVKEGIYMNERLYAKRYSVWD